MYGRFMIVTHHTLDVLAIHGTLPGPLVASAISLALLSMLVQTRAASIAMAAWYDDHFSALFVTDNALHFQPEIRLCRAIGRVVEIRRRWPWRDSRAQGLRWRNSDRLSTFSYSKGNTGANIAHRCHDFRGRPHCGGNPPSKC